ncbi:MAG: outer membrane lipoprotein-sorting protein [Pseudomonadales bacterium]|nr:outer membrane lipoprotein-sorting protein [Pseudomonadales bacterium]
MMNITFRFAQQANARRCLLANIRLLLLGAIFCSSYAGAQPEVSNPTSPPARTAESLIDEMEALYQGQSSRAEIRMEVVTPQYQRAMTLVSLSQARVNTLIRILTPKKERGISTLKLDQEMWNYFPKINKVIKIPPSMMMGSWMGSDFTNDDLVKQTTLTEEYFLELEETAGQYRIILKPRAQTVTVWGQIDYVIDREHLVPVSQTFYDDRGVAVRKLTFSDLTDFDGRLLPARLEMIPLNKSGHKTVVVYESLSFNPPEITDDVFSLRNLKSRF